MYTPRSVLGLTAFLIWYRYDGKIVSYIFGNILIQICYSVCHGMIQIEYCIISDVRSDTLLTVPKMYDLYLTSDLTTHLIQFPTPGCVQVCAMVHVHVHGIFVLITPSCHSAFLKWAADDHVYCNKAGGMGLGKGLVNDKYLALIVLIILSSYITR